jgi:hypothetical protein
MIADKGWLDVYDVLLDLHTDKASTYGSDRDALANYVETSAAVGQPPEYTCWLRIMEKAQRALNMILSVQGDECEEGLDVAALAIAAEALRRRRTE